MTTRPLSRPRLLQKRWISYWDDAQGKRFSDWDHAVTCDKCSTLIVHVYTVGVQGKRLEVGKECLKKEFGWSSAQIAKAVAIYEAESSCARRAAEYWVSAARRLAKDSSTEAERDCRIRNTGLNGQQFAGDVTCFRFGMRWYALPSDCASTAQGLSLIGNGWIIGAADRRYKQ